MNKAQEVHNMISGMVYLFAMTNGHNPNEIWAHPVTMQAIQEALCSDNLFLWWRGMEGDNTIMTSYAGLKVRRDSAIMPGVIYLDTDGKFTHHRQYQARQPYISFRDFFSETK